MNFWSRVTADLPISENLLDGFYAIELVNFKQPTGLLHNSMLADFLQR